MLDVVLNLRYDLAVSAPCVLSVPSLKGNRKGQHSIRVNDHWRICFVWHEGHVYQVEIVDYH